MNFGTVSLAAPQAASSWRWPPSRHHQIQQQSAACWHRRQSGWHRPQRQPRRPVLRPCSAGPRSRTAFAADRNRGSDHAYSWRRSSGPAPRRRGLLAQPPFGTNAVAIANLPRPALPAKSRFVSLADVTVSANVRFAKSCRSARASAAAVAVVELGESSMPSACLARSSHPLVSSTFHAGGVTEILTPLSLMMDAIGIGLAPDPRHARLPQLHEKSFTTRCRVRPSSFPMLERHDTKRWLSRMTPSLQYSSFRSSDSSRRQIIVKVTAHIGASRSGINSTYQRDRVRNRTEISNFDLAHIWRVRCVSIVRRA